jgi:hypothetical protein
VGLCVLAVRVAAASTAAIALMAAMATSKQATRRNDPVTGSQTPASRRSCAANEKTAAGEHTSSVDESTTEKALAKSE